MTAAGSRGVHALAEQSRGSRNGCPCCIGKPLRGYTTWNTERGEANIPSKRAVLRILRDIIGDGKSVAIHDKELSIHDDDQRRLLLEQGIRRRLERLTDPEVFHPIDPKPQVGFPEVEKPTIGTDADIARRAMKRLRIERLNRPQEHPEPPSSEISRPARDFDAATDPEMSHEAAPKPRAGSKALRDLLRSKQQPSVKPDLPAEPEATPEPIMLGDSIAAKVRKIKKGIT